MTVGEMEEEDEKPRTLLVGNIPQGVRKSDIEDVFGEIGPLKRCYLQYPREYNKKRSGDSSNETLLAYVTFAIPQDAVKALETLGNTKVGGNKIYIKFSKTRNEQVIRPESEDRPPRPRIENERKGPESGSAEEDEFKGNPNMIPIDGVKPQKPPRVKTVNKRPRLIIRNLSFQVTEEKLRDYFGACGDIRDINILKKPDGKLVGCAFVQYSTVPQAAKAVRELNSIPFLGRPIAVDWALSKKDFQGSEEKKPDVTEVEIKSENEDEEMDEVKIKIEPEEVEIVEDKFRSPYEHLKGDKKDDVKKKNKKRKLDDESNSDDDEDDDDEEVQIKRPRKTNDVEEGKTLFIRNLDFGVTEEELREFFEEYGQLHYALLCRDRLTEHPKGTGFVKFKDVSSATDCLTDFNINVDKFKLGNRNFSVSLALAKEKVESKSNEATDKNKVKNDNRNLYLVREGFVRPGSGGAEGVSPADMNKRAFLNSKKKQYLKDLSVFVSPNRLCVHNLPLKLNDRALRSLFKKNAPPEARITESRIMRDMKDIQLGGKGKSKGYGFVTFTEHEHALAALRTVNNNPTIFTPSQRPIVEFSLENRKALQAKAKRQERSIEKNKNIPKPTDSPTKSKKRKRKSQTATTPAPLGDKSTLKTTKPSNDSATADAKLPEYSGLKGKPGISKLPIAKPKGTGKITRKSLKGGSKQKKFQERRMREPQLKPKKQIDKPDKVEKMASKYRNQLEKGVQKQGKKSGKWYK